MTASVASRRPVTVPDSAADPVSIPLPAPGIRLSAQAADYRALVDAGVLVVDTRDQTTRDAQGVLSGAIALEADTVLDRLTPGTAESLRSAHADASWLLISDDGYDAEWLAWHLQARGVTGALFLVGGHRALRRTGVTGRISARELADISAH